MASAQAGRTAPDDEVRALAERAAAHAERGEMAVALATYQQLLALAPNHTSALNFVAVAALQGGDVRQAIAMLQLAVTADAADAGLHKNLGLAYRAAGSAEEALRCFREASRLKPDFVVALLNEGALLVELRHGDEALAAYMRAFNAADRSGLFLHAAAMPAGVQVLVEKAMSVLTAARETALRAALAPVAAQYGEAALARVWQCLNAYLHRRPPIATAPMQRPTMMGFPIPGRAWFERRDFPWLADIEARTGEIRDELVEVLKSDVGFRPFVEMPVDHPGAVYWQGVNHSPSWNAFFFYRDGQPNEDNRRRCPRTAEALDTLPLIRIGEHSPESLYSVLTPGAHIPPHTGVINCRLVVHLPLIVPPACGIRVGTETRGWEEGKCIVFDDTFEHEAWNRSDRTRVVLIFDIWNPSLTEAERAGMRRAVEALGDFNRQHGGKQGWEPED
jgi:aspartate beta-hydroxylase